MCTQDILWLNLILSGFLFFFKGRLIDLINLFGQKGGFQSLHSRICDEGQQELNVQVLAYFLR